MTVRLTVDRAAWMAHLRSTAAAYGDGLVPAVDIALRLGWVCRCGAVVSRAEQPPNDFGCDNCKKENVAS